MTPSTEGSTASHVAHTTYQGRQGMPRLKTVRWRVTVKPRSIGSQGGIVGALAVSATSAQEAATKVAERGFKPLDVERIREEQHSTAPPK